MQIRPTTQTSIPGQRSAAGRAGQAQESLKPSSERIVLEQTPARDMPRVHDVASVRELPKMSEHGLQAPKGEVDMPNNGEVRKQLAGIDSSMRKRLMAMGRESGLDPAATRALAKQFHQGVKSAFEAFKAGDIPDKQALMLQVRQAFQTMKEGFHTQVAEANGTQGGANTTPTITSTGAVGAGNVVATQTQLAGTLPQDPVAPPTSTGSGTSTTTGNVIATQTPALGTTTSTTQVQPGLIVDPVGGPEDIAAAIPVHDHVTDQPAAAGIDEALASLVERFEAAVATLGELFERAGERDHGHGFYDAAGLRDAQMSLGQRLDATA